MAIALLDGLLHTDGAMVMVVGLAAKKCCLDKIVGTLISRYPFAGAHHVGRSVASVIQTTTGRIISIPSIPLPSIGIDHASAYNPSETREKMRWCRRMFQTLMASFAVKRPAQWVPKIPGPVRGPFLGPNRGGGRLGDTPSFHEETPCDSFSQNRR
jgi:hypothetical protein